MRNPVLLASGTCGYGQEMLANEIDTLKRTIKQVRTSFTDRLAGSHVIHCAV